MFTAEDEISAGELQADLPPRTLLCVGDHPANLLRVEDLITHRPTLRLLRATDSKGGIECARQAPPDVILMDLTLPGICGATALGILGSDPATAGIPVIAVNANAKPPDIGKGLAAGFFAYLTLPLRPDAFMSTLDAALRHAESGCGG